MAEGDCEILNATAEGALILSAEHAGFVIPAGLGTLGLAPEVLARDRNLAGDAGTLGLTRRLAKRLGATALLGGVSRLVIDLNRAETAPDLIPLVAHGHAIPGNAGVDETERARRIAAYHRPFHAAFEAQIGRRLAAGLTPWLFSVHSFTPSVALRTSASPDAPAPDIGLLHVADNPLVAALRGTLAAATGINWAENFPYDLRTVPPGGLHRHGVARGLPCAAVEISIDRLRTPADEATWADRLATALSAALAAAGDRAQAASD